MAWAASPATASGGRTPCGGRPGAQAPCGCLTRAAVDIRRPSIVARRGLVRRSVRRSCSRVTPNAPELRALGCLHGAHLLSSFAVNANATNLIT